MHSREWHIKFRSQLLLGNLRGSVLIDLVTHAVADTIAARRHPLAEKPRPRVTELLVRSDVNRLRVPSSGDVLFDEAFRQCDPLRNSERSIGSKLILRCALGVVVVDGDHGARLSSQPCWTRNGAEVLERLGDLVVRADVSHGCYAKFWHV